MQEILWQKKNVGHGDYWEAILEDIKLMYCYTEKHNCWCGYILSLDNDYLYTNSYRTAREADMELVIIASQFKDMLVQHG